MIAKILAEYANIEDGMTAVVFQIAAGFSVSLRDDDANEYVGVIKIFPTEAAAHAYAQTVNI